MPFFNVRDHLRSVHSIILSGGANECWLHTCDARKLGQRFQVLMPRLQKSPKKVIVRINGI